MNPKKPISGLKLALKASVVSGMTLLSRILGLVRDVVFARFFGAGLLMDAFLVAQRIPNMLRRFFAEGAFSAGFVPVMARYKEQHDHDEQHPVRNDNMRCYSHMLLARFSDLRCMLLERVAMGGQQSQKEEESLRDRR